MITPSQVQPELLLLAPWSNGGDSKSVICSLTANETAARSVSKHTHNNAGWPSDPKLTHLKPMNAKPTEDP